MKIFVGILYSGENEFEDCLASIRMQTYSDYDIHVFENLPKFEAHKILYTTFLDRKDSYQLLIKIDADMVLNSPELFARIVEQFKHNASLDVLEIAVHDFFSNSLIHGLNSYRNTVNWELNPENVNADKAIFDRSHYYFDDHDLAPAATHCKNPSNLQAFHFGVHRAIKVFAPMHSTTHWALLEKTRKNFLQTGNMLIGLAVLGAELVFSGKFTKDDIDYTTPKIMETLINYQSMDCRSIKKEIIKLRLSNWGLLSANLRRKFLRRKLSNNILSDK